MKTLKRLTLVVSLALVLAAHAFAGETNTPPCSPVPGETNTPPCDSSPMVSDDQVITSTSTEVGLIVIETTVSAVEIVLLSF